MSGGGYYMAEKKKAKGKITIDALEEMLAKSKDGSVRQKQLQEELKERKAKKKK